MEGGLEGQVAAEFDRAGFQNVADECASVIRNLNQEKS